MQIWQKQNIETLGKPYFNMMRLPIRNRSDLLHSANMPWWSDWLPRKLKNSDPGLF